QVDRWLHAAGPAGASAAVATISPGTSTTAVLACEGAEVVETPVEVRCDFGRISGILAAPPEGDHPVAVVMLNAGAIRRIGPNRMWVELARRWASQGVPTFRLDFAGIGDAEGDRRFSNVAALYEPEFAGQISAALDVLQRRLGAQRFVLTGLCSGGYWAFQGALRDPRVVASASINAGVLEWSPLVLEDRRLQPLRDGLRRSLRKPFELPRLTRVIAGRLRGKAARALGRDSLDRSLDRLRERNTKVLLLFAELEPQLH